MKTNKNKVIDAAAKIFLSKGYEGCTVRAISQEAGLANASCLFNYFKGKEEIYQAVIDTYILQKQDPREKYQNWEKLSLLEFIDLYVGRVGTTMKSLQEKLNADQSLTPATYIIFIQEACRKNSDCKEKYYNSILQNTEMWEFVIRKAIESGEIKADTNIVLTAQMFYYLFVGTSYVHAIQDGLKPEELQAQYYCLYNIIKN